MNVKQSINQVQIIGTLKEMNLEETTKEVTLDGKKITCKQIGKKEFKNPMFLVEVNGEDIGVDFFPVYEKKSENGEIKDNDKFKAMQTVMRTYVPKSVNAENPTRVKIDGSLGENGYVDKNTFEYKSYPKLNGFRITSTSVPETDTADCEISGVIKNIYNETKGEDGEETGRLKVDFLYVDYNGAILPVTFVVESDLAEDFNSFYEIGKSVKVNYEVAVKHVGHKKVSTGGFGRRESNIVSGFSVTEYSIFRGEEPYEEENDYYISIDDVKKLLEEREIMIENKIKEEKEKRATAGSVKETSVKSAPFGNSTPKSAPKKNPFV